MEGKKTIIKFKLFFKKEIVGFEMWNYDKSKWYYSKDNKNWTTKFIPHDEKYFFLNLQDYKNREIFVNSKIEGDGIFGFVDIEALVIAGREKGTLNEHTINFFKFETT